MSNRDPYTPPHRQPGSGHSSAHPINGHGSYHAGPAANKLNPGAGTFQPIHFSGFAPQNGSMAHANGNQVSQPSHDHLERRVDGLEREQFALRTDVEDLKTLCNSLHSSVEMMKKGGWSVSVGPFKDQSAAAFRQEFDQLTSEVHGHYNGANDYAKKVAVTDGSVSPKTTPTVPPHLRGARGGQQNGTPLPPHLRGTKGSASFIRKSSLIANGLSSSVESIASVETLTSANNPLVTDGNVDTTTAFTAQVPAIEHTPPCSAPGSPATTIHPDVPLQSIENLCITHAEAWKPHFLGTLPPLPTNVSIEIPSLDSMTTFHPDFLRNTFGGVLWSPGLTYIPPAPGPCILRNRTYYVLDAAYEPYLPSTPGTHGAKLTAFFNKHPAEEFGALPEGCGDSSENVPMFVLLPDEKKGGRKRYVYFGHYSQTRWSDKLDYDRMVQCVPQQVREYWAEELSASGRPGWVTDALMKHFFPKPEYEGRMFGVSEAQGGSVMSEDLDKREEKVLKDVKRYVEALREWEKDARMKTAMIKKDFIMQAFERVSFSPLSFPFWGFGRLVGCAC